MRQVVITVLFVSLAALPMMASGQESVARSRISSVNVFKNGLALVEQEIQVPGAGIFRLDTAPNPVHGTFWIKSNCQVESALKELEFETPRASGGLQDDLTGKEVTIHLKDKGNPAGLSGSVEQTARNTSGFLVLKTAMGSSYINSSEIAYIEVKGAAKGKESTVKEQRAVLVLTVAKTKMKPAITVSYLTPGLSWAPSYLVEIADGKPRGRATPSRRHSHQGTRGAGNAVVLLPRVSPTPASAPNADAKQPPVDGKATIKADGDATLQREVGLKAHAAKEE